MAPLSVGSDLPRGFWLALGAGLVAFAVLLAFCWHRAQPVLFDSEVTRWVGVARKGTWRWDAASAISDLASGPVRIAVGSVFTIGVAIRTRDWWWAAAVAVAPPLSLGARELTRALAERPRPPTAALLGDLGYGFPSGHSAGIAATLAVIMLFVWMAPGARSARWPATILAALVCLVVGFSRIVLGAHFPTDVTGGFLLGACVSLGTVATVVGPARSWFSARRPRR